MTRRGVTLVEVLFAIGLILVGMVGLISVIPVAGHQAQDAISLNTGAAMATTAYGELKSREFLNPDNWVLAFDTGPTASLVKFPTSFVGTASVCIDPIYMSDRQNYVADASGGYYVRYTPQGTNGHRRFRFPYYKENHNPLVDPSLPTASGTQWPAGPRMFRVSVDRPSQSGVQIISQAEATLLSQGSDDLAIFLTDDRTLNPVLESAPATVGGIPAGQISVGGRYTWMATVNPLPGSPFVSVSTVIFRGRDRSFYSAANSFGAASLPRDNAAGERLAYVTEWYGFQGGAGGTVVIAAARNTPSDVRVNDWVMLSRNVPGVGTLHRWYRVMSTIDDPVETTLTDPVHGTDREVWARRIMLDGPDWTFNSAPGVFDDTFVTIVENVVAVTEHTVRIQD